jgi:hypothetical protein
MAELPLELAELIRRALDDRIADVHTSAPGTVVKFDSAAYTVDVQLGNRRQATAWDGSVAFEDPPIIPGIPVACFGTTRAYLKSDLAPGDKVWLIFAESSPAEFLDGQAVAEPADCARHSMSGALAIPFVLPTKLGMTPVVLGGAGADFVALSTKVDLALAAIVTWAGTHTHIITLPDAPSAVAVPVLPDQASTAATEVKAK